MLNLVIFGPPGAGKGTQSAFIANKYNLGHLSTGDMLRAEIGAGTELGLRAKTLMDKGELVPDEVVIGMIANIISSPGDKSGFIFDGFPRTTAQAEALDNLLESKAYSISAVLSLAVDKEELIARLLERGKTSGRADDRNAEIIENRILEYQKKTATVAEYYDRQEKLVEVNGLGTIEDIKERLSMAIGAAVDS